MAGLGSTLYMYIHKIHVLYVYVHAYDLYCRYFDIVPFSRMEFYQLVTADAISLCLRTIQQQVSQQSALF